MRTLALAAVLAVSACAGSREAGGGGPAGQLAQLELGEFAGTIITVVQNPETGAALTGAAPSGSTNGSGGWAVSPNNTDGYVTSIWCELEADAENATASTITAVGNVFLWTRECAACAWGRAPNGDSAINFGSGAVQLHWTGPKLKATFGPGARAYCQQSGVVRTDADTLVKKVLSVTREKK